MEDEYPSAFSKLSDDVALKIFFQLEDDPRHWARLSCVCRKFSSLISTVCCKSKCLSAFPSVSADLLSSPSPSPSPSSSWAALYKLAVCCPGLLHAGLLLDNSDFGLHRDIGSDSEYVDPSPVASSPSSAQIQPPKEEDHSFVGWSLYDDLYFDTVYNNSESQDGGGPGTSMDIVAAATLGGVVCNADTDSVSANPDSINNNLEGIDVEDDDEDGKNNKRRRVARRLHRAHLASGSWSLNREQGNKLLASRFRGDCLYICDWPGCVHMEEKRNYMLFRGFFKNFKRSRVWRTINDGNKSKIDLNCAFCSCKDTWDLHSAFCLRRGFGFHDDGEPVVRAYVCENGHVSGAWTDLPLYT